jgi:uncharacterized damage-inducible protein DinB
MDLAGTLPRPFAIYIAGWRAIRGFGRIASALDAIRGELLAYVGGLSATDLERSFDYRDLKGNSHRNVLGQTLQHLANHGTYHRGQVTTMLRQLGAKPVATDMIAFYRERAAQAAH